MPAVAKQWGKRCRLSCGASCSDLHACDACADLLNGRLIQPRWKPVLRTYASIHSMDLALVLEVLRHIVERALEPTADLFDIGRLDHQGRSEHQSVPDHPQN